MKRILLLFCCLSALCACSQLGMFGGGSNGGNGGEESVPAGLIGWFAQDVATAQDFAVASDAIITFEVLTYKSNSFSLSKSDYFDEKGRFDLSSRLRSVTSKKELWLSNVKTHVSIINFIDESTMIVYGGELYAADGSGVKGKTILYKIDAGPVLGELVYCTTGEGTYRTYVQEGNKVISTSGSIYTLSGTKLIQDGSSNPYQKFIPGYLHGSDTWGNEGEIYKKVCANVNGWLNILSRDYYIGDYNCPDIFFTPVIDAKAGGISGNVKFGWETGVSDYTQDMVFSQSELPATAAYNAINWEPSEYAAVTIFDKTYQNLEERYRKGELTKDEYDLYKALIVYTIQNRESALDRAEGIVRFFAEVDGKRYYVKKIHWSKKKGIIEEIDNTTNNLSKPNIKPDEQKGGQTDTPSDNPPASNKPSKIKIDGDFSDWNKLDAGTVSTATCAANAYYTALKCLKVCADAYYVYVYFEYDKSQITWEKGVEHVPVHLFFNSDGKTSTGGFDEGWSDACTDVMLEGFLTDGVKIISYNPEAFKWAGQDTSGWAWNELEVKTGFACGAGSGNAYEIRLDRELFPGGSLANRFSIGVDIQQGWDSVGLLPNTNVSDNNKEGITTSLWVQTYN